MTEFGTEPSFRTYLQIIRQRKWWVGSITVLGLAASLAFSLTAHKEYSATAQLLVQATVNASALDGGQEQPVTQTDVETELQLVTSAPVQQAVRNRLHSTPAVSASEVGQTNVMAITAISSVPSQASLIANLYATAFVQYQQAVASQSLTSAESQLRSQISLIGKQVRSFGANSTSAGASALLNQEAVLKEQLAQMQVSGATDTGNVELVTPAQTPVSPSSPKPAQDAILGLVASLALGLAAAFLRNSFDDRLTSKQATENAGGVPVLAMTPQVTWPRQKPLVVSLTEPTSPAAESYRSLRTSLQFARQELQLRSLVLTSPGVGEGKTVTLANLGVVFAQAGERVLLVSCDLRRPRIGSFFGLEEHEGLTSVLLGQRTLEQTLLPVPDVDRLSLLPAGPVPSNPAELLNSAHAQEIFMRLRNQYDLVLIDSPPVLPVTDAAILSQHADATLILAAAGQTRRSDLHRTVEKLDQVGAKILGTVLNKVSKQTGTYYGYTYAYKPYRAGAHAGTPAVHLNGNSKIQDRSPN
jgi:capsular exopolysaccharide synthesis family protein